MSSENTVAPKRKLRPARKQVAPGEIDKSEGPQPGKEYNVWYNKWAGGDKEDALANKTLSQSRCVIVRDAGYTRADATGNRYCCLFFARGCCPYGHECNYLHRLPLPNHQLQDHSRDCFGREKHAEYRDDMGGVGSFNRVNRTLYIAKMGESPDKNQTKETLLRHFGEWGKIVKWNILYNRGIAFVTYESEHNASFAKEAMANQSMDMDEVLNVRWATEDPNPAEKRAEENRIMHEGQAAIAGMLDEDLVEAAQTLRALEEGDEQDFYPIEPSKPESGSEQAESSRPTKRLRNGTAHGDGAAAVNDDDDHKADGEKRDETEEGAQRAEAVGMFSADAMDNLRFYAEMTRKQAEEDRLKERKVPPKPAVTSLLGGYGSDDDSD